MVDTKEALEGQFLNAFVVENSPSKQIVCIDEGGYKEVEYNGKKSRRLELPVSIDGKLKIWRPNQDSIKNMNRIYGADTKKWIGMVVNVRLTTIQGKDTIVAEPVLGRYEERMQAEAAKQAVKA